jgi:hypothetical protein
MKELACFKELPRMLGMSMELMVMKDKGKQTSMCMDFFEKSMCMHHVWTCKGVCLTDECGALGWRRCMDYAFRQGNLWGAGAWILHFSLPTCSMHHCRSPSTRRRGLLRMEFGTNIQSRTRRSLAITRSRREQFLEAMDLRCVGHIYFLLLFSFFLDEDVLGGRGYGQCSVVVAFSLRGSLPPGDAGCHETPTGQDLVQSDR